MLAGVFTSVAQAASGQRGRRPRGREGRPHAGVHGPALRQPRAQRDGLPRLPHLLRRVLNLLSRLLLSRHQRAGADQVSRDCPGEGQQVSHRVHLQVRAGGQQGPPLN